MFNSWDKYTRLWFVLLLFFFSSEQTNSFFKVTQADLEANHNCSTYFSSFGERSKMQTVIQSKHRAVDTCLLKAASKSNFHHHPQEGSSEPNRIFCT